MSKENLVEAMKRADGIVLPEDLTVYIHWHILDAIGSALAGAQTGIGQNTIRKAKSASGAKDATIIGNGARISALEAVDVNSRLGRLPYRRDSHLVYPNHPGQLVIFAALAAGELLDATLEDIVAAIAVAYEMILKVGPGVVPVAWPPSESYPNPALRACFTLAGVASIVELVLLQQLGEDDRNSIIELVLCMVTLLKKQVKTDSTNFLDNDGLIRQSNKLMSQLRLTGSGWNHCFIRGMGFKPTAFDRFMDAPTRALIKALQDWPIKLEDIDKIQLKGITWVDLVDKEKDEDVRLRTASSTCLYLGGVHPGPSWHVNGLLHSPAVADLASKVLLVEDFEGVRDYASSGSHHYTIQIDTNNYRSRLGEVTYRLSGLEYPRTEEEFKEKFIENSVGIIRRKQMNRLLEIMMGQENVKVTDIVRLAFPEKWIASLFR